jgi:1-aminocyclopropane-1-carboxylate deaminase/D-cysteine desulfhydrase-like pyridoxal-dependent ACC family enzyme
VSPDDPSESIQAEVSGIVAGIERMLELPPGTLRRNLVVDDRFVGAGYGIPSESSAAALKLAARTEGIVLDPVYTAKAMAAMIAAIREGIYRQDQSVLFWHTGGQTALFSVP